MKPLIISAVFYIALLPILLRLACMAHTEFFIKRKQANMPRNKAGAKALPKPLWPPLKERIRFTMKDNRPFTLKKKSEGGKMTNKQMLRILWAAGLAVALAGGFLGWKVTALSTVVFFFVISFAATKASPIIKAREQLLTKMFEIGKANLGISMEYASNPAAVISIQEWREPTKPGKVQINIPTTFGADSEEGFLRQFNQVFGTETTWVPFTDPDSGKPGWNYEEGLLTLKETPPLPQMAPWDEHYVLDPSIAWSFFPLGLGVEHGVELANPSTGEMENVLGFDVAGEQPSLSKKLGTYCSQTITTSPMCLLAGGTGGGKALAIDTMVLVKKANYRGASSEATGSQRL